MDRTQGYGPWGGSSILSDGTYYQQNIKIVFCVLKLFFDIKNIIIYIWTIFKPTRMNSNANEGGEATPEQIKKRKEDQKNQKLLMEDALPFLRTQMEYFETQARIDEAIVRRERANLMLAEMKAPKK